LAIVTGVVVGGYYDLLGAFVPGPQAPTRRSGLVTIIWVMSETLPLAQIKAHLSEIVDRVEHEHERVVLTRNGRPAAVLISPDDLEALEETLSILSDPKAMRAIRKAEVDLDSGNVVTANELRAKYLQG
jgi:antitoxin YefM